MEDLSLPDLQCVQVDLLINILEEPLPEVLDALDQDQLVLESGTALALAEEGNELRAVAAADEKALLHEDGCRVVLVRRNQEGIG